MDFQVRKPASIANRPELPLLLDWKLRAAGSGRATANDKGFRLSPSDFAYLWRECPRCYFLKVALNKPRPSSPMPSIFNIIDRLMKVNVEERRTEVIAPGMPPGVFTYAGWWVESDAIFLPGRAASCFIRGPFDVVASLDDGTFAVVDLKTTQRISDRLSLYDSQLHAYAWALEHSDPDGRHLSLRPVTKLGLLVFDPDEFSGGDGVGTLTGRLEWVPSERDDLKFADFLSEVVSLLESPAPAERCQWCADKDI